LLEALRRDGLPPSASRILFVSVDPAESPADAADLRRADLGYARLLAGAGADAPPVIERLVGPPASIAALARQVGFVYQAGDAAARFQHPAGVVVVTPDGRVSRYLMGVRFDAGALRAAVEAAAAGGVGGLTDRIALLCAHLDPRSGVHSAGVVAGLRATGLATLALLAAIAWRSRGAR
jgi:protein SCO1/2